MMPPHGTRIGFCIKTFLRPSAVFECVMRIGAAERRKRFADWKVYTLDDTPSDLYRDNYQMSREQVHDHLRSIANDRRIELRLIDPPEILPVPVARNILSEEAASECDLLVHLDDDFWIAHDSMKKLCESADELSCDIKLTDPWVIGGRPLEKEGHPQYSGIYDFVVDREKGLPVFARCEKEATQLDSIDPYGTPIYRCHYLRFFLLGSKDVFLGFPFDPLLHMLHHPDFFFRLWMHHVPVFARPDAVCYHARRDLKPPPKYKNARKGQEANDLKLFRAKWGGMFNPYQVNRPLRHLSKLRQGDRSRFAEPEESDTRPAPTPCQDS